MATLFNGSKFSATDAQGNPLSAGRVYTYAAGTLTGKATYTDQSGLSPNTNPVILDSGGRANIWLGSGAYRFIVKDTNDVIAPDGDVDNIVTAESQITTLTNTLSSTSGASVLGFDPTVAFSSLTLGKHLSDDFWNVCDTPWGAVRGTGDATSAVQACINAASAAGAGVYIPPGTFYLNSLSIPSNTHIKGAGRAKTILRQITGANDCLHTADPGSSSSYTSNITISDLTLQGTVTSDGFQEVLHLMFTQGASDLSIDRVNFLGFRGDGLYIGTGNERGQNPTQIRHNRRVRVSNCLFDGQGDGGATLVSGQPLANRNGISIIDCDGLWVTRSTFTNISQLSMPGCIDIEPDSGGTPNGVSSIIRNLNFRDLQFRTNYGQGGIALNLPNGTLAQTVPIYGITIDGCDFDTGGSSYGAALYINSATGVLRTSEQIGLVFTNNSVKNWYSPAFIRGVRGVDINHNRFGVSKYSMEIGDSSSVARVFDVNVSDNWFQKVASDNTSGGNVIFVYDTADNITFRKNFFDQCGKANGTYSSHITLNLAGAKTNIAVEDNVFYQAAANATSWDVRLDAGSLASGTTRHSGNRLINVNGGTVSFNHDFICPSDAQVPSLSNSWVDFGSNDAPVGYWKDSTGTVHLRGAVKNGTTTAGLTILSLPAGFRPGKRLSFVASAINASTYFTAYLQIENTIGDLQIASTLAGNTMVSLSGISFKAEA